MCSKIIGLTLALCVICSVIRPQQGIEVPDVVKKQVKKVHARCLKQSGATEALVAQGHTANLPTDTTFKCFMHCMFDMFGLVDAENVMHLEFLLEVLPEQMHGKIKNLADACGTQKGTDGCDVVYQTIKCYIATDPAFIENTVADLMG